MCSGAQVGGGGPLSQRGQACEPAPDRRKNIEEEGKESANPRPHGIFTSARGLFGSAPGKHGSVRGLPHACRSSIVSLLFPRIVLEDFWGRILRQFFPFERWLWLQLGQLHKVWCARVVIPFPYSKSWSFRSPHNFLHNHTALEKGPFERRGRIGVFPLSPNATRPTVYGRRIPHSNFIR